MINICEIRRIPRTTMRSYGDDATTRSYGDDAVVRRRRDCTATTRSYDDDAIARRHNEARRRNKTPGARGVMRLGSVVKHSQRRKKVLI